MTRRIAFINEKGGSCKTTLAVNTAAYLASELGDRVLLVDMDPQGQAGKCLGLDVGNAAVTLAELLQKPALAKQPGAIHATHVDNLSVLVANKRLADIPVKLANAKDAELRLRQVLDFVDGQFDHVIVDSPPSLGMLSTAVMLAVKELVIPLPLTFLAMDGCAEILETVDALNERAGHDVNVVLMVPTLYRATRLADEILAKLRAHFGGRVSQTVIGYSVKVDEAQSFGQTIWQYAPRSPGAFAMEAFAKELVRVGKRKTVLPRKV